MTPTALARVTCPMAGTEIVLLQIDMPYHVKSRRWVGTVFPFIAKIAATGYLEPASNA